MVQILGIAFILHRSLLGVSEESDVFEVWRY